MVFNKSRNDSQRGNFYRSQERYQARFRVVERYSSRSSETRVHFFFVSR
jgi:hypothetical protein